MKKILDRLIPFVVLGVVLVIFVFGIIFLSYLLIWGAIIGLILFVIGWVKEKFSRTRGRSSPEMKKEGRIIEHDK